MNMSTLSRHLSNCHKVLDKVSQSVYNTLVVLWDYYVYLYYSMDKKFIAYYTDKAISSSTKIEELEELINLDLTICVGKEKHFENHQVSNVMYDYNNLIRSKIYYFNTSGTKQLKECIKSIAFITGTELSTYVIYTFVAPIPVLDKIVVSLTLDDWN